MTTVVHVRDGCDVRIGRPGTFGNPFVIGRDGDRGEVIARHAHYFRVRVETDPEFRAKVLALKGKRLGCYCAPFPCHGDTIAAWVEAATPPVADPSREKGGDDGEG